MALLTDAERQRIEAAVRAMEARTRCEFVAVLAPESDGYGAVRWGVPALAALAVPWPLLPFLPLAAPTLLGLQLLVFAVLGTALAWPALLRLAVPDRVLDAAVARAARAQFHALGVAGTAERTGVLLYVSLAEHRVEILADSGVAAVVSDDAWRAIVDRFVAEVRKGRPATGLEHAIIACGDLLARHFPGTHGDPNELPDAVVEL